MTKTAHTGIVDPALRSPGPDTPAAAPPPRAPCGGGSFLSTDRIYRYLLWRHWDDALPYLCYIMLNPSTADETHDDATIRVCVGRAKHMGYGAIIVANLFALRATNPDELYQHECPISHPLEPQRNNSAILSAALESKLVICAWGRHGAHHARNSAVFNILASRRIKPWALRINADGSPAHPLRIPYSEPLKTL